MDQIITVILVSETLHFILYISDFLETTFSDVFLSNILLVW